VSSEAGALELIARVVGESLSPLKDRLQAGQVGALFEDLGLRPPDGFLAAGGVGTALTSGATAAQQLADSLPPLATAIDAADANDLGSIATLVASGVQTISKIVALVAAVKNIADAATAAAAALTLAQRATLEAFAAELPQRLLEFLILANLDSKAPRAVSLLALAGIADDRLDPGDVNDPLKIPHRVRRPASRCHRQARQRSRDILLESLWLGTADLRRQGAAGAHRQHAERGGRAGDAVAAPGSADGS
jgi:hypothetical protein